jgi:hypothetical protein
MIEFDCIERLYSDSRINAFSLSIFFVLCDFFSFLTLFSIFEALKVKLLDQNLACAFALFFNLLFLSIDFSVIAETAYCLDKAETRQFLRVHLGRLYK